MENGPNRMPSPMNPSPPETRASLILRLPDAADVAAWDEFVSIYGPVVFRLAIRQGMQPADADNLIQEVFTSVARSVSQWLDREDRGSFRAWLMRIARNQAVNMLTRRATRPLGTDGMEAERILAEVPDRDRDLSNQFDIETRREIFAWAADRVRDSVSPVTWQAFWLTRVEGVSIADAADRLGMNLGNIYIGRSRVMSRLRDLVNQFEDER